MARYLATLDAELRPKLDERTTELGVTPPEPRSTLSFDTIRGGVATNIVPDRCTVTFNRRLLPASRWTPHAQSCSGRWTASSTNTASCTRPSRRSWGRRSRSSRRPAARSASSAGAAAADLGGSDDQRFVVHRAGITNSLVYGPGTTALSHISDERIAIDDLVLGTKGLALILDELLAV
jgi:succinyl-diaminopimelate desuccinylase